MKTETWTDLEIERWIDGDLEPDRAAAFASEMEVDAALAARVRPIRCADAVMRLAMQTAAQQPPARAVPAARHRAFGAALAAVLVLAAGAMAWWMVSGRAQTPQAPILVKSEPDSPSSGEGQDRFRVVLAVELPKRERPTGKSVEVVAKPAMQAASVQDSSLADFQGALSRGAAGEAREKFDRLSPEDRRLALEDVGRAVRSAGAAEAVLDSLPVSEQVQLARSWAIDGMQRPVAFARLRSLMADADAREQATIALRDLAARPELAGWVASYGLGAAGSRTGS